MVSYFVRLQLRALHLRSYTRGGKLPRPSPLRRRVGTDYGGLNDGHINSCKHIIIWADGQICEKLPIDRGRGLRRKTILLLYNNIYNIFRLRGNFHVRGILYAAGSFRNRRFIFFTSYWSSIYIYYVL